MDQSTGTMTEMDSTSTIASDSTVSTMRLLHMQWQQQKQQQKLMQRRSDPPAVLVKTRSVTLDRLTATTERSMSDSQDRKIKKSETKPHSKRTTSADGVHRIVLTRTKSSDSMSATGHALPPELSMMSDHSEVDIYGRKVTSDSENTASTNMMTDSERSEEDRPRLTPVHASAPGTRKKASTSSVVDEKSVKTQKTGNKVDAAGAKRRKSKKLSKRIDKSTHTEVSSSSENAVIRKEKNKSKSSSSVTPEKDNKNAGSVPVPKRTPKSNNLTSGKEEREDGTNIKTRQPLSAEQVEARLGEIGKLEQLLLQERNSLEAGKRSKSCKRQIFEFFFKEEANRRHELVSEVTRLQLQLIGAHQGEHAATEQSSALKKEIEKFRAKLNSVHDQTSDSPLLELQKENEYLKSANEMLLRQVDQQGTAFGIKLKRKEETVDYLIALLGKMKTLDSSSHHGKYPSPSFDSPKSAKGKVKTRVVETDPTTPTNSGKGKGKINLDEKFATTPTDKGKLKGKIQVNETDPATPNNTEATKTVLARLMKPRSLKKEASKKKKVSRSDLDADALKPPLVDI
jgi:hypothetical protein